MLCEMGMSYKCRDKSTCSGDFAKFNACQNFLLYSIPYLYFQVQSRLVETAVNLCQKCMEVAS